MNDPNVQTAIDMTVAGHSPGLSPADDPFAEFESEQQTSGATPDRGDDDFLAVFPGEVFEAPGHQAVDMAPAVAVALAPGALVEPVAPLEGSWTRAGRRTFSPSAVMGVLVFVVGVVGGAVVSYVGGGQGARERPAEMPADGSNTIGMVALPADDLPLRSHEPLALLIGSGGERDLAPLTNVSALTSPVAVRQPNVERAAPPTDRATIEVPRPIAAAEPIVPEFAPSATPVATSRAVAPDVVPTGGAVAVPGIVATAGTLPPGAAPVVAPPLGPSSVVATTAVIESVLGRYAAAFTARDVAAAKEVWPGVNERGLLKAFDSVEEQRFDLGRCVITATPPQAVASCDGTATYVPKVGSKRARSEPRHWTFRLEQHGQGWSIEAVDFR